MIFITLAFLCHVLALAQCSETTKLFKKKGKIHKYRGNRVGVKCSAFSQHCPSFIHLLNSEKKNLKKKKLDAAFTMTE